MGQNSRMRKWMGEVRAVKMGSEFEVVVVAWDDMRARGWFWRLT